MKISRQYCFEVLKANLNYISKEFEVTSLSIFGSIARGDQNEDSDVDILVSMPPRLRLVVGLKEYLEEILNKPVDLIRYHSHLSPRFLNSISKDAIQIF